MPRTKLRDLIPFGGCAHEFCWPRRCADDEYYQVCTLCGAEYRYDWKTMRRTERLPAGSGLKRRSGVGERKRPTWSPRARRLRVQGEIKYRVRGASHWHSGAIQNISQSGVLFHGPEPMAGENAELMFEMPKEIAGQEGRSVLCSGTIVRSTGSDGNFAYAVSIRYYRFMARERDDHRRAQSAD